MKPIFKTWQRATYFKGKFALRNENINWATPIEFPTVFVAYGPAVKSGNWQSCTAINTPDYVIKNYFDTIGHGKHHEMYLLWTYCKQLNIITWKNVKENRGNVLELIRLANVELLKLETLNN